jgi:C4-dicarboxylate-binding protein DctP
MKSSLTRRLALAAAVAAAFALNPLSALAQAPIVIKFSHVVAPDTPKGNGALRFKQLAEERTKGRVKVEVYPNSQLYKDKEEMEALQLGSVQMLAPSLAKFGPLGVKEFEVFDLPFIFKDTAAFKAVTDGPVGADLRALGAIPQVMAFSELYQGLQSGVVDGTEGVPSNFYTQKIYEVQKHITLSNHGHLAYAVIVNKKFWDGLPADIRTILEGAMKDATTYANDIAAKENVEALDKIKASGKTTVYTPTAAEISEWKKALMPVHKEMEGRVGKPTIDAVYKAAGFVAP